MEKKSLTERMLNDILSDNTQVEYCKQCETCIHSDGGDDWSNHYTKSYCAIYAYPRSKPLEVINNKENCPYYELT